MTEIETITRFIAFLPDPGVPDSQEMQHAANSLTGLRYRVDRCSSYLFAAMGETRPAPRKCLLDVFPGTAASNRFGYADFGSSRSIGEVYDKAEQSAQCYNLINLDEDVFSIESDALGLKPVYIARTEDGHLLASRIADMLHIFPALADPADRVGLYEMMMFWTPLAGRTLHQSIKRTPAGGCYRWSVENGLSADRRRAIQPVSVDPLRLVDQTVEEIRDTAAQSLRDKSTGAASPILMGLSGGFDSRLIAALCSDQNIEIRALTYGRRHNEELLAAQAVACTLNLEVERLDYPIDATLRHLDHHLNITEGCVDPATLSIMNLFELDCAPGTSVIHGYCGDVQAGKLVGRYSSHELASPEALADAILRFNTVTARPELLAMFEPSLDMDEVRADVLSGLRQDCPLHQSQMMWEFENRQRGYVGSQMALIGDHFDTIMPFYDRRLFAIWTSIPPIGLVNRSVFRSLLARYYPALAKIPHPEERAPITPNLHWQVGRFRRRLPRTLLVRTLGEQRTNDLYLRLYRHDDIMMLSKLSAPQQQAYMLSRIKVLYPALRDQLGVELSPGFEKALSGHLKALRGLFLAAEYARYRAAAQTV